SRPPHRVATTTTPAPRSPHPPPVAGRGDDPASTPARPRPVGPPLPTPPRPAPLSTPAHRAAPPTRHPPPSTTPPPAHHRRARRRCRAAAPGHPRDAPTDPTVRRATGRTGRRGRRPAPTNRPRAGSPSRP